LKTQPEQGLQNLAGVSTPVEERQSVDSPGAPRALDGFAAPVPELFVLRDEEGPILYAPLGGLLLARLDEEGLSTVKAALDPQTRRSDLSAEQQQTLATLEAHHFFDDFPRPVSDAAFKPCEVTLFPTNRCNLRCVYCYTEGGEGGALHEELTTLDLDAGKAAIDLVARNAKELNAQSGSGYPRNFLVSFHGNGEPFAAFDTVRELCFYARDVSEAIDFPVVLNAATNGVLTEEQCDFLLAYFDNVNISFDGLPDIQDRQRPRADGAPTFELIDRTLRRLDASSVEYGIRTTVTAAIADRLSEITRFVAERYPRCTQLHLEPVWACGRCRSSHEEPPDAAVFTDRYLEAADVLAQSGSPMRLVFSGARKELLCDAFCKVNVGSFTVTPTGDVTACYEVSYRSDPRSARYFFGRYDPESGVYVFDEGKLAALHELTVHNMPFCARCFCKWHCAGDCAAKVLGTRAPQTNQGSDRCEITRRLTLKMLQRELVASKSAPPGAPAQEDTRTQDSEDTP